MTRLNLPSETHLEPFSLFNVLLCFHITSPCWRCCPCQAVRCCSRSSCTTSSPGLLLSISAVRPSCPGCCYGLWSTDWMLSHRSGLTLMYVMKWWWGSCGCCCFHPLLRVTVTIRKCTSWNRNCKYLSVIQFPRGEIKVVDLSHLLW